MKREVVVLLTRAPYGRVHVPEGLRAARGVAAGFDMHDVTVIFTQDGVYGARDAVDREALNMSGHVVDLAEQDGQMVADGAAMAERGVDESEIADDVAVWSDDRVTARIRDADRTLDF
ncbi:tRNA 2-thiouridine synthesizing protein C [Haloarcula quadrata]|mgnify:FL=1|jgi:tRNA 2-thiouridine synthesizing protein C|uniref:Intracellular sulfur reduction protein n=3 Tax=Haloarcula TaxID=2237 RepID=Q5V6A9_HALMA|nr:MULTISPECIES: DsrE family protein [Haloarcula]AAV44943.1 intracellular sulfur reduction protein [Haloarcula marismortui ATCC 43049]EMA11081.1 intracellular sulfur reduction protein [Haloarcula sinaiiensis ATCC 33800]NHN62711.1 DsrE family protein [Haloarcula sp. JP-Z28]QCP90244.1 sulfur oxidoreductase [Haloarcula marismortui ATCC 43049]QUJ74363.1 DsrE family protein [Haloarcula sinaiiensis ATCC 33800]